VRHPFFLRDGKNLLQSQQAQAQSSPKRPFPVTACSTAAIKKPWRDSRGKCGELKLAQLLALKQILSWSNFSRPLQKYFKQQFKFKKIRVATFNFSRKKNYFFEKN
jgi:hypothetical protein